PSTWRSSSTLWTGRAACRSRCRPYGRKNCCGTGRYGQEFADAGPAVDQPSIDSSGADRVGWQPMDAVDRYSVALLKGHPPVSLAENGERVGGSQSPCWKRIQRVEKSGVILRRVALVAPESIGMGLTVFVSIETGDHSSSWLAKFAQTVTAMPEVMEFHRMAGDIDYMLRVAVPDMQAYDAFYKKLIDTMPLKN